MAGIDAAVAARLPAVKSMRRNTQRHRNAGNNNVMAVPQTRAALPNPLPQEYTTTNNGAPFLRWDSGDADRILLFGSQEKLNALQINADWFVDGTFDSVPLIYGQLVTVHALVDGVCIPCVYALLPDKSQATYTRMFYYYYYFYLKYLSFQLLRLLCPGGDCPGGDCPGVIVQGVNVTRG